MTLSTAMNAAVSEQSVTLFTAVQIALPTYTINLLDTAGYVTFAVNGVSTTFTGSDSVFGSLASVQAVGSTMGNEAPRCAITLLPPTDEAIGALANPSAQGSPVRAYEGVVDQVTGAVVGTPHLFWSGLLDVAYKIEDGAMRSVELDTVSVLGRFLTRDEGRRLTVAWQQQHFPGSRGLAFNVLATEQPAWGVEGISGVTGFGGGVFVGGSGGTTVGGGAGGGGRDLNDGGIGGLDRFDF